MGKDPAFLLYFRDFLVSTAFMTNAEVGAFIRGLCHQADKGHLETSHLKQIAAEDWDGIAPKFSEDFQGKLFNKRLDIVMKKRTEFTNSRRRNRLSKQLVKNTSETSEKHMGNGSGNANEDRNWNDPEYAKPAIPLANKQHVCLGLWLHIVKCCSGDHREAARCVYRAKAKNPDNIEAYIMAGLKPTDGQRGYIFEACEEEENNNRKVNDWIDKVLKHVEKT
jgi:hypothetical protein